MTENRYEDGLGDSMGQEDTIIITPRNLDVSSCNFNSYR